MKMYPLDVIKSRMLAGALAAVCGACLLTSFDCCAPCRDDRQQLNQLYMPIKHPHLYQQLCVWHFSYYAPSQG